MRSGPSRSTHGCASRRLRAVAVRGEAKAAAVIPAGGRLRFPGAMYASWPDARTWLARADDRHGARTSGPHHRPGARATDRAGTSGIAFLAGQQCEVAARERRDAFTRDRDGGHGRGQHEPRETLAQDVHQMLRHARRCAERELRLRARRIAMTNQCLLVRQCERKHRHAEAARSQPTFEILHETMHGESQRFHVVHGGRQLELRRELRRRLVGLAGIRNASGGAIECGDDCRTEATRDRHVVAGPPGRTCARRPPRALYAPLRADRKPQAKVVRAPRVARRAQRPVRCRHARTRAQTTAWDRRRRASKIHARAGRSQVAIRACGVLRTASGCCRSRRSARREARGRLPA